MPAFLSSKWIFALLGAAILSLACAIVGMFVARAHLVTANDGVRHTSEVALSIGSCRLPGNRGTPTSASAGALRRSRRRRGRDQSSRRRARIVIPSWSGGGISR
jgi:hypothetical protein